MAQIEPEVPFEASIRVIEPSGTGLKKYCEIRSRLRIARRTVTYRSDFMGSHEMSDLVEGVAASYVMTGAALVVAGAKTPKHFEHFPRPSSSGPPHQEQVAIDNQGRDGEELKLIVVLYLPGHGEQTNNISREIKKGVLRDNRENASTKAGNNLRQDSQPASESTPDSSCLTRSS